MLYGIARSYNQRATMTITQATDSGRNRTAGWSITIVVPIYNENDSIPRLVDALARQLDPDRDRVVFVNDGSTDGSAERCDEAAQARPYIRVIHLEPNRGKTEAIKAGFAAAEGNVVVTMDGDLQDDPQEIPRLLEALDRGLDLVCGWKQQRRDPWVKRWSSRVYNGVCARLFGLHLHDINSGFKAMRVEVARAAVLKHDYHRLIPAVAAAQGFRVGEIPVEHHPRRHGASKFGFERYWQGLRDAIRLWWEIRTGRLQRVVGRNS